MKYMATFIQAHAKAVSEAALLGWWHHINAWVSVPALSPPACPLSRLGGRRFPVSIPLPSHGKLGPAPRPSTPTPYQWGHPAPLTGCQEAEVEIHGEGILGTAVLQTRGRVRDGKLQFCAGIAAGTTAQGHGPVPRSQSSPTCHTPFFPPPTTNPPWAPVPGAAGADGEFAGAGAEISFHRAITEMGPANPTSWIRPGLGQSKAIWSDWLL